MKRSIIFLMALIVLCALPVFASTPEQDMVLIVDEGDGDFSELEQVSDEEMANVEGNRFSSAADGASNITLTAGSVTISGSKNIVITTSKEGGAVVGIGETTNTCDGYTWSYNPNTGITTYTYTWTSPNGKVCSTTWQVDGNVGTYPHTTTSTSTNPSFSDGGASWK